MGITIHYRGTIDDPDRLEDMENRIVDLAFALGGQATIWRSYADHNPQRMVRGVMLNMAPGHETFSLLVSPEGHLTPLWQIEEAEQAPFDEPPFCFVKTQFGSMHGHVAIVHILDALKQGYFSQLKVTDEGEYYESRDVQRLLHRKQQLDQALASVADGLREHGLSDEAAEDPDIVASRVERIAKLVHQKMLANPVPESPATEDIDDFDWNEPSLEEEVEEMDRLRRKNESRGERMTRRIAEARASGLTAEEAFRQALQDEGLHAPDTDSTMSAPPEGELFDEHSPADEPWQQSVPFDSADDGSDFMSRDNHPALEQAERFLLDLMHLLKDDVSPGDFASVAQRGAMNIVGGLAQATSDAFDTRLHRALAITQLKRALTGHAFARGAIFALRGSASISNETVGQLQDQLADILSSIHKLSAEAWDEPDF